MDMTTRERELGVALLDVWDQLTEAGQLHRLSRPLRLRIQRLVDMPEPDPESTSTSELYRALRWGTRR